MKALMIMHHEKQKNVLELARLKPLILLIAMVLLTGCASIDVVPPAKKVPKSFCNGTLSTRPLAKTSTCYRTSLVKSMQSILNRYGFDAGPEDGVFGARTLSAYTAFLETQNRQADAYLTGQTIRYMTSVADDYPRLSPKVIVVNTPRKPIDVVGPTTGPMTHWAMAARTNSIGHAVSKGRSREQALRKAESDCNAVRGRGPSGPNFHCRAVGAFALDTEGCMAVVNGFVPATRFTAHFGRSISGDRNPRKEANDQAFERCESVWKEYAHTACRKYNGGASNATRTFISYCTSDIVVQH